MIERKLEHWSHGRLRKRGTRLLGNWRNQKITLRRRRAKRNSPASGGGQRGKGTGDIREKFLLVLSMSFTVNIL